MHQLSQSLSDLDSKAKEFIQSTEAEQKEEKQLVRRRKKSQLNPPVLVLDQEGVEALENARRDLKTQQRKLKRRLDKFDDDRDKIKHPLQPGTIHCVEILLEQYRLLQAEIKVLANEVDEDQIQYLRDYAQTIKLARKVFKALGDDEKIGGATQAFHDHIITLPAKQPLTRLDLFLGIGFIIIAVIAILIPIVHFSAFLSLNGLASTALGLAPQAILSKTFDLIASGILGLTVGISTSMACFTFFGNRKKAHPRETLDQLSWNVKEDVVQQAFKTVKSTIRNQA